MVISNLDMSEEDHELYRELRDHLDKLPIGFPETKSGVELRILRYFFTPEEAKLALKLNFQYETLDQIYERVDDLRLSKQELRERLDDLARKGSIRSVYREGEKHFATDILVIGMYEAKVNNLTEEFINDMNQYIDEGFSVEFIGTRMPQTRTVPVEESITPELSIPTYEEVAKIVEEIDGPIMLLNCICRQSHDIQGEPCKQTSLRENCMGFGNEVQIALDAGRGREIDKLEALEILRKNQEDGLILQAGNTLKPHFICSCCGCCCGIISGLKDLPRPRDFFSTDYYAEIDQDLCIGCGTCIERCQLDAIRMKNDISRVNKKRCVGCGNCVVSCSEEAIKLKRDKKTIPYETSEELYAEILRRKQAIKGKK